MRMSPVLPWKGALTPEPIKGGHDKKKYPASKTLLIIGLFPCLPQSPAHPLGSLCAPSAPGWFLWAQSAEHSLLLQVANCLESLTINIPVPHSLLGSPCCYQSSISHPAQFCSLVLLTQHHAPTGILKSCTF